MMAALSFDGVDARLAAGFALDGVDFGVAPGEVVGLVGANGSGKTTVLRLAAGIVRADSGEIRLSGRPMDGLGERARSGLVAYLPQERRVEWNLPAWRIVALGAPDRSPSEVRDLAVAALTEVGLAALAERGVREMSGGERARVLFARLLIRSAPLIVADEPASGLDVAAQFLILERLRARADHGAAVLVSLHDLTLAARACDRLVVLKSGKVVAVGPPQDALNPSILELAFGLEGGWSMSPTGPVLATKRAGPAIT